MHLGKSQEFLLFPNFYSKHFHWLSVEFSQLKMIDMNNYFWLLVILQISFTQCLLYPFESETRETKSLDGIWKFRLCPSLDPERGFNETWYQNETIWSDRTGQVMDMPVPSSFNDIGTDSLVRDFVGWAWYYRTFYVPISWVDKVSFFTLNAKHQSFKLWFFFRFQSIFGDSSTKASADGY